MRTSLNEVETMAKRACRGAGLPWGIAEETGKAARWLAIHGFDAVGTIGDVLQFHDHVDHSALSPDTEGVNWIASGGLISPLMAGTALCDHAERLTGQNEIVMANVAYPIVLLSFSAIAAKELNRPIEVQWENVSTVVLGDELSIAGNYTDLTLTDSGQIRCVLASPKQSARKKLDTGCETTEVAWHRLNYYAQRTYAPATEASRLAGAGAGSNDND
ncbi:conserved hypothetical protein [Roseibium sp. TrichSKD4]|uniref:DUF3726 domain-containing protein n=1 Tax=Roseibium sp. TrichSKD4 TaxID=744980 RepID=UPI0001E574EC|nr:DUF3726 domain-containing protein [Roseibium sp. TrichSKD4]EFO29918.1 conserved hypothetical protein [Roseibium sp. TrichSKD4]